MKKGNPSRIGIALWAAEKYGTIVGAICLHDGMEPEFVNEWESACEDILGTIKYIKRRTHVLRKEIITIQNMRYYR